MINYKIGHGFDIHPLVTGRKCIIGGVQIPFEKGLQGHSDADVLLHALCDALIGAMGMGDIGQFFQVEVHRDNPIQASRYQPSAFCPCGKTCAQL